jgi:hypothetical protein
MDIYEHIDEMKPFIQKRDWKGLEAKYAILCEKLSGTVDSKRIGSISLNEYQAFLRQALNTIPSRWEMMIGLVTGFPKYEAQATN